MSRGFFVVGTDTGVGKTVVSVALIHALRQRGLRVVGMKPVAAGGEIVSGVWRNEDVAALAEASNVQAEPRLVNPYGFVAPIAPHIAAMQTGVVIDIPTIVAACDALSRTADVVVVESVGGFRVPLGRDVDTADLAVALGLPVVMVVGMRLGCLSHALLTAEAIERRGLVWTGWVANVLDPAMPALNENIAALQARLGVVCLGVMPNIQPHSSLPECSWLVLDALPPLVN
ncbi:MAG: dethiobiotin synthase [Thiobacillaceae bacterium]